MRLWPLWPSICGRPRQWLAWHRHVATSEVLASFKQLFGDALKSKHVSLLGAAVPPLDIGTAATLQDLPAADCVVVIGGDPVHEQRVLAYLAGRAQDRGALLLVVNDEPTELGRRARMSMRMDEIASVEGLSRLRSARWSSTLRVSARPSTVHCARLPPKARFLPLISGANGAGANARWCPT